MIRNIKNLMEIFIFLYSLAELFGKKLKISIYVVVFVILDLFLMVGLDNYGFPEYLSLLVYMGAFLYALLYYKESTKLTFLNCCFAYGILIFTQLLMFLPIYYLFFLKYRNIDFNELLINICALLLIILSCYKIKLKKISDVFIKHDKLVAGVFIFVLLGLGISLFKVKDEEGIAGTTYIQMLYFIFIFLFIIYEWQKTRVDVEKKKAQLQMNQLYYEAYDQLIILIRERQHDMKNSINAILSMIYTTDNYDELITKQKEYCGYITEQNEKTRLVLSLENPLIAGFLYSKIREAENRKIDVEYQIELKKINEIIPEFELVEMTGILFDNAIEALFNMDEAEQLKKIYIAIKETEENIEIVVANTSNYYEEDITARFFEEEYSSKGNGRGIGLSKLKKMVQNRNGNIIVSNELRDGRNYLIFVIKIYK